jgi:cell division protein ZapA
VAIVTLRINDKAYEVGCEDGAEAQLESLAEIVDLKARQIAKEGGPLGETRLMLLTALVIAEEVTALAGRAALAEDLAAKAQAELAEAQAQAARAIDAATKRIEAIGADW